VIFTPTPLAGAFVVDVEPQADERGAFARTFCAEEFARRSLCSSFSQCSTSFNRQAGTLRGLHYQVGPHAEAKLVRATAGAIFDVIVDLRAGSPTRRAWFGVELSASNRRALYVPEGFAHGFQALTDGAEVFYQISRPQAPDAARGVRWDDPAFKIAWPRPVSCISERDSQYPDYPN
jgi:dTDP-4-dehydrorhamnose 3,5-epimerase